MPVSISKIPPIKWWLRLKAWQRIFLGLVLGIITGCVLGRKADYLQPIGTLFLNAIHMIIVPVVFTAIICAILTVHDPQKMRRLGLKTISLYVISLAIAASIGIIMATLMHPGAGMQPLQADTAALATTNKTLSFSDIIVSLIPSNPVAAFAQGNILQVLFFAILLGFSINLCGEKAKPVAVFFQSLSHVVFKFTNLIMSFAPLGIFALMAVVTADHGIAVVIPLAKYVATVYLSCALFILIFYAGALWLFARLNPLLFFKGAAEAFLFAFSSSSSAATLPVTIRCAENNLGISKSTAEFLLPLGTALNLNGLSIYLGIAAIFTANMYGVHLSSGQYVILVMSIVLTSMGAGGVPGSAIIVMSAVLSAVGLPIGAIPLLAGVDRLNDMAQTATNVTGDLFAATVVAKSENELNEEVYIKQLPNTSIQADLKIVD